MPTSPTPEWKLVAFRWLPLDRWTSENLFELVARDGKRMCRVCDVRVKASELDKHTKFHVKEETARQERMKEEAAAQREQEREWLRNEKEALGEKVPRRTSTTAIVRAPRGQRRVEAVPVLEAALTKLGEATLVALAKETDLDVSVVRSQIKSTKAVVVGHVKSGGRGRPAVIYGLAKSKEDE